MAEGAVVFDRLGEVASHQAWGERAIVSAFAENWDRELFGLELPEWRPAVVDFVERLQHRVAGDRLVIADMGCAAGAYARHFLQRGIRFEYHGYEHNEFVLRETCRRWEFLPHEHVHFHRMDVRVTPWPIDAGFFDVVLWDSTLRICDDPAGAIAESGRVCRGVIVLARTPLESATRKSSVRTYGMDAPSVYWHFDEAWLRQAAASQGLTLSLRTSGDDMHLLSHRLIPEMGDLKPAARRSRVFHEAYVRERVARLLGEHDGPWVIFGAGAHSRWLWAALPAELRKRFLCFVDERAEAGQTLGGLPVRRPEQLSAVVSCQVLVSSDSIEATLGERARVTVLRAAGVHRLYDGLPPGPYDKAVI